MATDLRSFDNYRLLKLHDMATHTWTPEASWDTSRGQYAIIHSAVNSSGRNMIYDVPDGSLALGVNGVNYLYFKGHNSLGGAKSTSLDPGSVTEFTSGLAPQGGIEAPILAQASGAWYLWRDANAVFCAWQPSDLSTGTWTATDRRVHTQPLNSKHAGIQPIPQLTGTRHDDGRRC